MEELLKNYNKDKINIAKIDYLLNKNNNIDISPSSSNLAINGDIKQKGYKTTAIEDKIVQDAIDRRMLNLKKIELENKIKLVDNLINILKYKEKMIIQMYYFKNMKVKDIANDLQNDVSTIRKIRRKALKKMSEILYK